MAHAQKRDFVFRRNGRVHLNRRGRQFSRLLTAVVCASAVVMLDTPGSEVVWRVLATHSIRQFSLHFPSRTSPCAITFQLDSRSESLYRRGNCHHSVNGWSGRSGKENISFLLPVVATRLIRSLATVLTELHRCQNLRRLIYFICLLCCVEFFWQGLWEITVHY